MTKISHEIPKALFQQHHFINDYPYLLAHLLHPSLQYYDKEYALFYKQIVKEYDYSILDNSAFELGDSIDLDILYTTGEEYKPTHLILPDCLHNSKITKERAENYLAKYADKSTPKFIGVIQGETLQEFLDMYEFYLELADVDIVAIPFNFYTREQFAKTLSFKINSEDLETWYKTHRVSLVERLLKTYNYNLPKKLHLLGCFTPNEFMFYNAEELSNINSVDTSAPIIYGWNQIIFPFNGLDYNITKPKEKLAENLDIKLNNKQLNCIATNVRMFRTFLFNRYFF
jgi:hypothetical protein